MQSYSGMQKFSQCYRQTTVHITCQIVKRSLEAGGKQSTYVSAGGTRRAETQRRRQNEQPEQKTSEDQKTLNKFNNFIKSLTNKSKPSTNLESRMPNKWY